MVWYHNGNAWVVAAPFQQTLGTADRLSVWGRAGGASETFYLSGQQTSILGAILRCTLTPSGSSAPGTVQCASQSGVQGGEAISWILGTEAAGGGQGPLWGAAGGSSSAPEDI